MPIISEDVDPFWHEKGLMILLLNKGAMFKRDLFNQLAREQKKKTILGEKGQTHSRSAYNYWVKSRERQWVASEYDGVVELTPVGKWIMNSTLGTFSQRDDLVSLVCGKCAKPADLVFLKPLPDTAEINAKGRLFMDFQCPRCQNYFERMPISEVLSKEEFVKFYNKALTELRGIIKGELLAVQ